MIPAVHPGGAEIAVSTPQQTAPQQTAPQQTAPQQTAPEQAAPELTAPQQTDPHQAGPNQAGGAQAVRLPPGPRLPRQIQGLVFLTSRRGAMRALRRRYGRAYTVHVPIFGPATVISDPALVRQLFLTSTEHVGNIEANLGRVLGAGSLFNLDGAEHHRQRKLLIPPFHGKRMATYEAIVEEETLRAAASWPEGEPFPTLAPMMRITLNAILRAVFGAEGAEFEALRTLMPRMVALGSRLAVLPLPRADLGQWSPWGRFNAYRREFDALVGTLIDKALADPGLADRDDVLSIMLQARYDDGEAMTRGQVADQLATLLAAGHETTATTLAWAVERLRRHPGVLARLVAEADAGGSELRRATILEVQRTRPVIDLTARRVKAETLPLGEWVIPHGHTILVGIGLVHADETVFPRAARFDPDRFAGVKPDRYAWVPFGGGFRRCLGAAFADMEMNVVLATLLREFELSPTHEPGERWHSRGVAYAPGKGGLAVVHRRARPTADALTRTAASA
jgi:cytochrome P450 family 138